MKRSRKPAHAKKWRMSYFRNSRVLLITGVFALSLLLTEHTLAKAHHSNVQTQSNYIHVVRSGETLAQVAKRFHTTSNKLKNLNHLTSIHLKKGQRLVLPVTSPSNHPVVKTAYVNIHSKPQKAGSIVGEIPPQREVSVLKTLSNGWVKIQYHNLVGYVYKQSLSTSSKWQSTADDIIRLGKTYEGEPDYVYGATRLQDHSFDCSSFTQFLYGQHGIHLGATSREQAIQGTPVVRTELQKGDLLFFSDKSSVHHRGVNRVAHVAIYIGNNKILHTYEPGIGVTISRIDKDLHDGHYWRDHFLFARRVIPPVKRS